MTVPVAPPYITNQRSPLGHPKYMIYWGFLCMNQNCEICEISRAITRCRICGRYVCSKHIDKNGVCVLCNQALCKLCRKNLAVTSCPICGRVICYSCSKQLTPVIRLCIECFNSLRKNINGFKSRYPRIITYLKPYLRKI